MAMHTQSITAAENYVKARPPLHGIQRTSVLSEIGNKLRNNTTENVDTRHPVKPTNVVNAARIHKKEVIKDIEDLTEALKNVSVTSSKLATGREKHLDDKEKSSYSSTLYNIHDIDKESAKDPLFIGEYAKDIFKYLRGLEVKYPLRPGFLCGTVTPRMRSILVDWLFDVQVQFSLLPETMCLTVAILDRYLQKTLVLEKKKIQLVGTASMLLASKFEETYPPDVSNFVYVCSNLYTKEEILKMERNIMKALDFFIGYPLSVHFLRRYSKACTPDEVTYTLAKYLQEICMLEYELCHFAPSRLAAAALLLALRLRSKNETVWTRTLVHYSLYEYKDIVEITKKIVTAVMNIERSRQKAVYEKYSRSKFLKVSCLPELSSDSLKKVLKLL